MLIMVYDFETSGLPLFHEPSDDPRQPHIVQACAVLVDSETREAIASLNLIAAAEDWTFDEKAEAAHGISVERSQEVGIDERIVVDAVHAMWRKASLRVAHNEQFDARIMRIALKRYHDGATADLWKGANAECTQRLATPILKLPPTDAMLAAGRNHSKSANLGEAFEFFTGQPMVGAHDALADVKACMAVYWAIKDREAAIEGAPAA